MKKFLLLVALFFVTLSSFAHVWEIRVNQNQNGSLTWYMQSYHGVNECGYANSGININGTNYPLEAEFTGSVAGLSPNIFTSISSFARASYAVVNTPYIAGVLNVTAYSNNACWDGYPGMPLGNQSFTPPPPPSCTSCPVTSWTNTMAASGNNNGTLCNPNDDYTTATIQVSHLACASITGDKQFRVIYDPSGANVVYGPFNYNTGIQTNVVINVPYGTSNSTQVNVIDDDFPCQIPHGLTIPGGQYVGEKDITAPVISCTNKVLASCETVIPNFTTSATVSDNCTASGSIVVTQSPAAGTVIAPGATVTITLTARDASNNASTCSFTVNRPNETPVANNDAATVCGGSSVNINVLGNDSHPQGLTLLVNDNSVPSVGTLVKNANNTFTYTAPANYSGPVTFTYTTKANNAVQAFAGNGHYYEFVSNPGITWTAARAAASARTFNGLQGYLVTITSAAENLFMFNKVGARAWIGGSDMAQEGVWKWMDGPEAGDHFSNQDKTGQYSANTPPLLPGIYHNWSVSEPNDFGGTGAGSHAEDYAHFLESGQWNDFPNSNSSVQGYAVEYGGLENCLPVLTATATVTITVNALPTVTANHAGAGCVTDQIELYSSPGVSYSWTGPNGFTSNQQNPIIVSGILANAGIYTVTVTNANGCSASASTTVTVNALPVITAGSNSPVCQGGTLNLSSNGGVSYIWTGPNGFTSNVQNPSLTNVSLAAAGTYSVKGTGANGCRNDATVAVTVNPLPVATIAAVGGTTACPGSSITLNANTGSGFTYQWSLNGNNISGATGSSFNAPSTGSYTVVITSNGCSSSASNAISITIADVTPPTITCSASQTVNNTPNTCGAVVNYINPTASDNCTGGAFNFFNGGEPNNAGGEDYLQLYTSGTWNDLPNGINLVFIIERNSINTTPIAGYNLIGTFGGHTYFISTFQQTWTNARASALSVGADLASINTLGETNFLAPYGGSTWVGGYQDHSDPGYIEPGNASQNFGGWKWVDGTKLGAGQIAIIQTAGRPSGSTFPVGVTTNTFTATDESGNQSTCSFTVTVVDNQKPVITTNGNTSVNNDAGQCGAAVIVNASATDNCSVGAPIGVRGDAQPLNASYPVGTTTIAWNVTDINGNAAIVVTQTVTVTDNERPTIVCAQPQTIDLDASCNAVLPDYRSLLTVSDNCTASNALVITQSPAAGTPLNGTGNVTVTFTVRDASNNSSTCSMVVTKRDVTPPTITCPQPITVNNTPNQCGTIVNFSLPATSDNCAGSAIGGGVHVLNRGDQFFDYANNVLETQNSPGLPLTFNPTDGSKMAVFLQSCGSTHYMYQDVTMPSSGPIQLGFDLQYNNTAGGFNTSQFIAVEIRSVSTNAILQTVFKTISGDQLSKPMTHYSYNLSSYAGQTVRLEIIDATINNSYFDVLLDNITLTGSSLVNGSFETGNYSGWTIASSNGGCGTWGIGSGLGVALTQTAGLPSGSFFPVGTTTNTFVATDLSGNTSTCSFTVTVTDNQIPVITTNGDKSVNSDLGKCGAIVAVSATAADNCSVGAPTGVRSDAPLTLSDPYPVGTTTITWNVTDVNGNAAVSVVQTIVVTDNENPVIVCPNDIDLIATSANGAVATYTAPIGTDNCSVTTVRTDNGPVNGGTFPIGETIITYQATDASGNHAECSFTVTVVGAPPVIHCPDNMIVGNTTGQCGTNVSFEATETTAIPASTITYTVDGNVIQPGSFFPIGTTTVTATATNAVGTDVCIFTITVEDRQAPVVINCTGSTHFVNPNTCTWIGGGGTFTISDNCPGTLVLTEEYFDGNGNRFRPNLVFTLNQGGYTLGGGRAFPVGVNTVVLTVSDAAGNVSQSCSFTVTVIDNQIPVITTNGNQSVNNDLGQCGAIVAVSATATDNCGVGAPSGVRSDALALNAAYPVGTTNITWNVTDIHGNEAVAVIQTIVVSDNEAPVTKCKPVTVTLVNGTATITAADINDNSTDNCGIASIMISNGSFNCNNIGTNTVTLTITDIHGNVSSCNATVTVVGEIPSCTIASIPTSNVYTGGNSTNLFLGYGAQSTTLRVTPAANGAPYTYSWSGTAVNMLSSTTSGAPVFTPTAAGVYSFTVVTTNVYGCTTSCSISICVTDIRVYSYKGEQKDDHEHHDCNKDHHDGDDDDDHGDGDDDDYRSRSHSSNNGGGHDGDDDDDHGGSHDGDDDDDHGGSHDGDDDDDDNQKVYICHVPNGNHGNPHTLSISINAVASHLRNHPLDRLGSCDQQPCSPYTDRVKPMIDCPKDITVNCNGSTAPAATGTATAIDNYSSVTLSYTDVTVGNKITRTWKATDVAGNFSTCTQKITIGVFFTASVSAVNTSLYLGYGSQTTTLKVNSLPSSGAPYSYSWTGANLNSTTSASPVFAPVAAGSYPFSVTITNKYGCSFTTGTSVCVTDIRVPGTTGAGAKIFICHTPKGKNPVLVTLEVLVSQVPSHISNSSCGGNGYDKLGKCGQLPCTAAVSTIVGTATNPIVSTMTKEGVQMASTEEELKVTVMPNPSTTYFTLKLESKYETPVNIRVMDGSGRVVDAKSKIGANSTFQIGHNYSSGTYYAEMIQGTKRKVVQLIKAKG